MAETKEGGGGGGAEEVRHASRNADSACHRANTKRGTLSQHFVTHVVPPLGRGTQHGRKKGFKELKEFKED